MKALTRNLFIALVLAGSTALACSTGYLAQSSEKIMVKSYDWHIGTGHILVNKRNVLKRSFLLKPSDKEINWVSKYGSVTFNQHGRGFPLGGINEAGLGVEIMWLSSSVYPPADERGTINELQWIQYQLDNFKTVAEVQKHARDIRISRVYAPVHYLVCDKENACITVENIGGKLVTHTGDTMPSQALTNDTYADSIRYLAKHQGFGGSLPPKKGSHSLDRFVRMASSIKNYRQEDAVDYGFKMLQGVNQGKHSKFQIVYELANGITHFRTKASPARKTVDLSEFNFSCETPVVLHDLNSGAGEISTDFETYTDEKNLASLQKGMVGIEPHLPKGTVERWADYPNTTRCLTK